MATDINCDMGEAMGNDELIMPYISSANIACGYHAGDADTMRLCIESCRHYQIAIGAHPSFDDRENFGRTEMKLSPHECYTLVRKQLEIFKQVADAAAQKIHHVKPHGALYNLSARDMVTANVIARAVKDFDSHLILYGLSGSISISEAKKMGLQTASEVFADRTYQDDGSLTPRSRPGALLDNENRAVEQVMQMVKQGTVTTVSGKAIPILAETICIHGDGKQAVRFAKAIHKALNP